jgi:hypothetical protein
LLRHCAGVSYFVEGTNPLEETSMLLTVRDETPSGESLYEWSLDFLNERITIRELIRERVHHEVKEFN